MRKDGSFAHLQPTSKNNVQDLEEQNVNALTIQTRTTTWNYLSGQLGSQTLTTQIRSQKLTTLYHLQRCPYLENTNLPASAKRDFNLRSQNNLSIAAFAHLAIANIFAMIAKMMPEEPYEPKSWQDAMLHNDRERWLQAANDEMDSLITNKTWSLVDPPPNRNILKGKWVFKYQRGPPGEVARYPMTWDGSTMSGRIRRQDIIPAPYLAHLGNAELKEFVRIRSATQCENETPEEKTCASRSAVQKAMQIDFQHIRGVLLGLWKNSNARKDDNKHAVYGLICGDKMRLKVLQYTRDGRPYSGNWATTAG
jgi:hypothetical protein